MARIKIISWAAVFIFLFLWLGLFNHQIIRGRKFRELSNKNCIRLLPQPGSRGRILDCEGRVIVDSFLSYDVMILPQAEKSIDKALMGVSAVLGISPKDLKARFKTGFVAPFMPVVIADNVDVKNAIALEELKQDLSGLVIQPKPLRNYPYAKLASHTIGYLNEIDRWRLTKLADYGYKTKDIVGFGGVEEKYDYYLRQEEGASSIEVDHQGRLIRTLGFRSAQNGKDIQLTLDLRLQQLAEESLKERKGSIIIMDPRNGQIKALASSPNFNPSAFVKKAGSSLAGLFNSPSASLMNRAISGVYPPASIFKLIVASAALETGKINLAKTFVCTGSTRIGRREFSCWNTHGQQNLRGGIVHSCDVFFYRTGLLAGAQTIYDYALKFGLSKPTAVDLPYESRGFIPSPLWRRAYKFSNWYDGDTANLSIGQGETLVTPLQLARMMAVFANKGYLVTPYILKGVAGRDLSDAQTKINPVGLKQSTINYIRGALQGVVSEPHGTAGILSTLPVSVAGKTGTAQVSRGLSHGWFLGFFPFDKPRFVICVFLEHGGSGYAASVLTKQIIETMNKEGLV